MAPGNDDDLPDKETFETDWPIPEEIGFTSSSEEDTESDVSGTFRRKRPRLPKPWCDLLFPKARIDKNPSVLRGMSPERELELRRYLADTVLTLVQKLSLSLDTFSVAVMFMHRFLMYRPVQTIDKRKLSLACVFLASKSTEDRRPPISNFVCSFYRLCYHRELNMPNDQNVFERLKQELLFWESQILLVLGFNMSSNLREIRREIDVFCEEQAHISKSVLRSALCVFVLNTLALTTIPVRCSYRLIYLVSISLTLAWAKQVEPRDVHSGKIWWQFFCMPNQPTVEGFESIKAEILRCFESTNTKLHDYFDKRKNSSASSSGNSIAKSSVRASNVPSGSSHPTSNGDVEGLTGMPIIPASHHNGVGIASSSSSNERNVGPHDNASYHRQSHSHQQQNRSHTVVRDSLDPSTTQHTRVREHASSSNPSASVHKHHHKHHHRERSERPSEASVGGIVDHHRLEHRHRKERRSGSEKHRRHSRSSNRRDVTDPRGDCATTSAVGGMTETTGSYPWEPHNHPKSSSKRSHFSTIS